MLLIRQSLVYLSLVGGKALKNINMMDSSVQGQVISVLVYRRVTYMYQLLSFFMLCGWTDGAILRDMHSIKVSMFRGYLNHLPRLQMNSSLVLRIMQQPVEVKIRVQNYCFLLSKITQTD